jgi:hypothetical protein
MTITKDHLRFILREYDDDTPVEVRKENGEFGEPELSIATRQVKNEEGEEYTEHFIRLL